jgi:hypothetical protein
MRFSQKSILRLVKAQNTKKSWKLKKMAALIKMADFSSPIFENFQNFNQSNQNG